MDLWIALLNNSPTIMYATQGGKKEGIKWWEGNCPMGKLFGYQILTDDLNLFRHSAMIHFK